MNSYPFAAAILEQTDGGLRIILDYYTDAKKAETNQKIKFKIRENEKTASATLRKSKGVWYVMDFGAWDKPKDAIGVCMLEDNLSFGEACKKLAKLYHVQYKGEQHAAKPVYKKRPRKKEEKDGTYHFEYHEEISDKHLQVLGPLVTNEVANRFNLKSVVYYAYVQKDSLEVLEIYSTEDYPIFVLDNGDWQKIYQPKSAEKKNRFRYAGGRPKDFLFGMDDAKKQHTELMDQEAKKDPEDSTKDYDIKLDQIVICSGDRDALNMASMGYCVIWKNSESSLLTSKQYRSLKSLAKNVCNLPDIDFTGIREAVKLGLIYLDIKTIWIPEYIKKTKDFRGNPRKDLKDFIDLEFNKDKPFKFKSKLKKLVDNAIPMKFWDETYKYDSNGVYKATEYAYNLIHAEHFLKHQGFYRFEVSHDKEEFVFVHIDGNVVKQVSANKIETYVNNFLEARLMPNALRNMVKRSQFLSKQYLSKLPYIDIDFTAHDKDTQYWFFDHYILEIKSNRILVHRKGEVNKMVWEDKVIHLPKSTSKKQFEESLHAPQFKISLGNDSSGLEDNIEVLCKDNKFFNYLINASRIHWRKELEESFKGVDPKQRWEYQNNHKFDIDGPRLDNEERWEQKGHLINKIFVLGYLLHKHKSESKAWMPLGLDNKLSDLGESHGGSGKSFMYKSIRHIMKNMFEVPGRKKEVMDSEFVYAGITENTDYVVLDDILYGYDYTRIFTDVTGTTRVNNKGVNAFSLEFEESPKVCGTSNFTPLGLNDSSTARRLLLTVHSDYYHYNTKNQYQQTRTISDDFEGKNLFKDGFADKDWLLFYGFMAQCLAFYLSTTRKINPPMNNVLRRNSMTIMGDNFRDWAELYFSEESGLLDQIFSRRIAYKNYQESGGKKGAVNFKGSIKAFCDYKGYVFNPYDDNLPRNKDGRIIKKINDKTHECFYIKSKADPIEPIDLDEPNSIDHENETPY